MVERHQVKHTSPPPSGLGGIAASPGTGLGTSPPPPLLLLLLLLFIYSLLSLRPLLPLPPLPRLLPLPPFFSPPPSLILCFSFKVSISGINMI